MNCFLYLAWVVALMGCGISIYYGEILWIEPCRLCWYQRISLFPLAIILGIAFYRKEDSALCYAWPFVLFGSIVSLYQALAIHYPAIRICGYECAKTTFALFDFLTFPDVSAIGFIVLGGFLYCAHKAGVGSFK